MAKLPSRRRARTTESAPDRRTDASRALPRATLVLCAALLLVAIVAFAFVALSLADYTLDDTFISLRYARNLASGHGLVYNVGERVEGYTNFLWTTFLAVPMVLRLPELEFLKLANVLLALGTAFLGFRFARGSGLLSAESSLLAAALVLGVPATAISAVEGLETTLFTLLIVAFFVRVLHEIDDGGPPWSGVLLAALAATRPDGLLAGVAVLAYFVARSPRRALGSAIAFTLLFGTYFAIRRAYYGAWLPNTFYAKGGGDPATLGRALASLARFWGEHGSWAWLLAVPALLSRRRGLVLACLGIVAGRVAFHVWSGGPWTGHERFLLPALPFVGVLVLAGAEALPLRGVARAATIALALAFLVVRAWIAYPEWQERYLTYALGLRQAHVALGEDVRRGTRPDAVMAMDDAGAAPYHAERTNIDMLGLLDAHIGRLPGRFYVKSDVPYVLSRRPDLVVLIARVEQPQVQDDWLVPGHARLVSDPEFRSEYRFLREYHFAIDYHLLLFRRLDSPRVLPGF